MPEQSHEEDPDYSPEQKNENDLECFSKLDQAGELATFFLKYAVFTYSTINSLKNFKSLSFF